MSSRLWTLAAMMASAALLAATVLLYTYLRSPDFVTIVVLVVAWLYWLSTVRYAIRFHLSSQNAESAERADGHREDSLHSFRLGLMALILLGGLTALDLADSSPDSACCQTQTTDVPQIVGPRGPQGDRGPEGSTGPQGPKGDRGPAGRDGRDGRDAPMQMD